MATATSIAKAPSQHLHSSQKWSEMSRQLLRAGQGWWGGERSVGGGHPPLTGPSWLRLRSLSPFPWISRTLSSLPPTPSPGEVWAHYTHTGWGKKKKTKKPAWPRTEERKKGEKGICQEEQSDDTPAPPFPFAQPCQRQRPLPAPHPPPWAPQEPATPLTAAGPGAAPQLPPGLVPCSHNCQGGTAWWLMTRLLEKSPRLHLYRKEATPLLGGPSPPHLALPALAPHGQSPKGASPSSQVLVGIKYMCSSNNSL